VPDGTSARSIGGKPVLTKGGSSQEEGENTRSPALGLGGSNSFSEVSGNVTVASVKEFARPEGRSKTYRKGKMTVSSRGKIGKLGKSASRGNPLCKRRNRRLMSAEGILVSERSSVSSNNQGEYRERRKVSLIKGGSLTAKDDCRKESRE